MKTTVKILAVVIAAGAVSAPAQPGNPSSANTAIQLRFTV